MNKEDLYILLEMLEDFEKEFKIDTFYIRGQVNSELDALEALEEARLELSELEGDRYD